MKGYSEYYNITAVHKGEIPKLNYYLGRTSSITCNVVPVVLPVMQFSSSLNTRNEEFSVKDSGITENMIIRSRQRGGIWKLSYS